jgi:hypothetical protein
MSKHVLIIGYGKMGKTYSKYIDSFGIGWDYYDPFLEGGLDDLRSINKYTHVLISTQPEFHSGVYNTIKGLGYEGYIYIDKPVVITRDLELLNDPKVFCGMTERYNPVVIALKELLNVKELTSIKFSRYSTVPENIKVPVLFDLGIHDLDLYLYLLETTCFPSNYDVFTKSKTCYIMSKHLNILSIFEWSHESYRRERKIVALQRDTVYEADLIDQTLVSYQKGNVVKNLYVNKAQSLEKIMRSFLNNDSCNAQLSHTFMFDILSKKGDLLV